MTKDRPSILITNDDGIYAKGINELINALKGLGDLVIMAPDGPRSGMASAITSEIPIKYKLVRKEEGVTVYSCTGTPVDCVKLAINEVLDRTPDLLVSGINHGTNVAVCVHYSGTLGAAAEGCIFGIPSIGISLTSGAADADFAESCRFAYSIAADVVKEGLPHGTYLNVNVPDIDKVKGLRVCQQADGRWTNEFKRSENAKGEAVFWLTGSFRNGQEMPDDDTAALKEGYASIVPCKIDVTDYTFIDRLSSIIIKKPK